MKFEPAIITFKRAIDRRGTPGYILSKVQNVATREKLPIKYLQMKEAFWLQPEANSIVVRYGEKPDDFLVLEKGKFISGEQYEVAVADMQKAGENLHRVMEEIRNLKRTWSGESVVTI